MNTTSGVGADGMVSIILTLILIAFIFFGLIPGIGAFLIRGRWHRFRQRLIQSSLLTLADASLFHQGKTRERLGRYRFFGTLESIQGENRLWVTNNTITVGIDVQKTSLYLLRSYTVGTEKNENGTLEENLPDDEPEYLPWEKIYSLPSGIQVYVSGYVHEEAGKLIFRRERKDSPLVIIFDGNRETLLKRCIWSGRQKNEYYNQFTTVSLILGSLVLLLISFLFIANGFLTFAALLSLTLSLFPIVYLLPPGVLLYFLYRFFWKRSRLLRSERDLLLLPLRYFPAATRFNKERVITVLPGGEKYIAAQWKRGGKKNYLTTASELKIRGSSLPKRTSEEDDYYLFGAYDGTAIQGSDDPMVELICVPGNPKKLAEECDKKSKELGIVSAICIFSGLLLNFTLIFFLLLSLVPT